MSGKQRKDRAFAERLTKAKDGVIYDMLDFYGKDDPEYIAAYLINQIMDTLLNVIHRKRDEFNNREFLYG